MTQEKIEAYVQQKLNSLEKQKDMQEVIWKGKFSFGIDKPSYGHLPAWKELVKQKKIMIRLVWLLSFLFSCFLPFLFDNSLFDRFDGRWIKAIFLTLISAGFMMLFYVFPLLFSLFFQFRKTESAVRKLIYQDILFQLKKDADTSVSVEKEYV